MDSKGLENFLNYLRQAEESSKAAQSSKSEAESATQDILHKLKLEKISYHTGAKLARILETVKQERRQAKKEMERLQPLLNWIEENHSMIKALERVLGEMRKTERNMQHRSYIPKTNILKEVELQNQQ